MDDSFAIYFADLRPAAQRALLDRAGLEAPEETNWDIVPLALLYVSDDPDAEESLAEGPQ